MIKYFQTIGIVAICMIAGIPACSLTTHHEDIENSSKAEEVICTEPRPEICTMDYQPVCASLASGSYKTYSNGCSACSDLSVISYRDGMCE